MYRPGVGVKSIHRRWMGLCRKPFQTLNLRTGVCVCLPVCERVCGLVCGTCQTLNPDTAVLSASCWQMLTFLASPRYLFITHYPSISHHSHSFPRKHPQEDSFSPSFSLPFFFCRTDRSATCFSLCVCSLPRRCGNDPQQTCITSTCTRRVNTV